jgi:hypothetical protein
MLSFFLFLFWLVSFVSVFFDKSIVDPIEMIKGSKWIWGVLFFLGSFFMLLGRNRNVKEILSKFRDEFLF